MIAAIVPASVSLASAATGDLTFDVQGTGFVADSKVRIDGLIAVPTASTALLLKVALDPVDVPRWGAFQVTVVNPPSSGGESVPATLTIG